MNSTVNVNDLEKVRRIGLDALVKSLGKVRRVKYYEF